MDVLPAHLNGDSFRDSFKGLVALEIIIDLPIGFPINNMISLELMNELMNELKPREARFQKTARSAVFVLRRQPRNFENATLAARRREHFRGFWADFFVAELPQKRGCFNTQECTRFLSTVVVVESCALTCPYKQSNPSIWSLLS